VSTLYYRYITEYLNVSTEARQERGEHEYGVHKTHRERKGYKTGECGEEDDRRAEEEETGND